MAASQAKFSNSKFSKNPKQLESWQAADINLDGNFITINSHQDFSYVLEKTGNRLLVVQFFAKWCGPCQMLSPKLEELADSYDGRILIVRIDVDECEELTSQFNILAIPTFIIMKNKKKLLQFFSSDVQTLEKHVEKYATKRKLKIIN